MLLETGSKIYFKANENTVRKGKGTFSYVLIKPCKYRRISENIWNESLNLIVHYNCPKSVIFRHSDLSPKGVLTYLVFLCTLRKGK